MMDVIESHISLVLGHHGQAGWLAGVAEALFTEYSSEPATGALLLWVSTVV